MMTLSFHVFTRPFVPLVLVALTLMLSSEISHAANWDIDQLMRSLAKTRSGHASFVEEKSIAMLEAPVESSGELSYRAPDHLERHTFKPKAESMTVDGDTLFIVRGSQKYRLQLQDYPELAAFIDSIRGILAGDRQALERKFRLSLEGSAEGWVLQLLPVDETMQAVVWRIRIAGVRDDVRSIKIIQADGDYSLMRIERLTPP